MSFKMQAFEFTFIQVSVGGETREIKPSTIINSCEAGGLKIAHLELCINVQKIIVYKTIPIGSYQSNWKMFSLSRDVT